jgi:hypothetical protein
LTAHSAARQNQYQRKPRIAIQFEPLNIARPSHHINCRVIMSSNTQKSKADIIEERRTNLPLPEQPPQASDWNSADARNVNVGSGGVQADISGTGTAGADALREPATAESAVRVDGDEMKTHTSGLDAGRKQ